ncbi:hypothetical protein [Streptacidiphilus sp. PAMC 29251]
MIALGSGVVFEAVRTARIVCDGVLVRCETGRRQTHTVKEPMPGPVPRRYPRRYREVEHAFVHLAFTAQGGRRIGLWLDLGRAPAAPGVGGYQVCYLAADPGAYRLVGHRAAGTVAAALVFLLSGAALLAFAVTAVLA